MKDKYGNESAMIDEILDDPQDLSMDLQEILISCVRPCQVLKRARTENLK